MCLVIASSWSHDSHPGDPTAPGGKVKTQITLCPPADVADEQRGGGGGRGSSSDWAFHLASETFHPVLRVLRPLPLPL